MWLSTKLYYLTQDWQSRASGISMDGNGFGDPLRMNTHDLEAFRRQQTSVTSPDDIAESSHAEVLTNLIHTSRSYFSIRRYCNSAFNAAQWLHLHLHLFHPSFVDDNDETLISHHMKWLCYNVSKHIDKVIEFGNDCLAEKVVSPLQHVSQVVHFYELHCDMSTCVAWIDWTQGRQFFTCTYATSPIHVCRVVLCCMAQSHKSLSSPLLLLYAWQQVGITASCLKMTIWQKLRH